MTGRFRMPHCITCEVSEPGGIKAMWWAASWQLRVYGPRPKSGSQVYNISWLTCNADEFVIFMIDWGTSNTFDVCHGP